MNIQRFGRNANHLRSRTPITLDQARVVAPSIFAEDKHESRSERYTYIPTVNVLEGLLKNGFEMFEVAQSRSRIPGKSEFTKHLIRLRQAVSSALNVGSEVNEVVMVNSHDGTSSYQLIGGVFVLVCLNGLVVPASIAAEVKIAHKGNVIDNVIEGAYTVVKQFDHIAENKEAMKALTLTRGEQLALADASIVAKYGKPEDGKPAPVTPDQVLTSRRWEQRGNDLWSTFNTVQENVVQRGGISTRSANGRRMRTRPVTGISENVKLNQALWTLADQMQKLKAA